VLVIEPDEDSRLLYTMVLEEAGYAVYAATDGPSGLAIARHRTPDVVITEIALPTIGGFDILGQLHDNPMTANIPVVVVTSFLHFDMPTRSRASGAMLVLGKPSEPEALVSAVRELILATPPERLVRRQLNRALLTLRKFATRFNPDADVQQRIRALLDDLQVAVVALDERGRYVAASAGAAMLTGCSRDELLTMSIANSPLALNLPKGQSWQEFVATQQGSARTTVRDWRGERINVLAAFVTILPGLHAAAIARA
jgi:PAS domain S-box-containing protein